jgi:hypothetical protein
MRRVFVVAATIGVLIAACDSSGGDTTTTVPATLTTSTTAATTTTTPPPPTTTTTAAPDTTTTTEVPATTTTSLDDTTVELTSEGIRAGATWVYFGFDDDDAVAALEAVLGPATEDTGWLDSFPEGWEKFGVCPSPHVRGVRWGAGAQTSLQLLFTDGDTDFWSGGVEHFYTYYYFGGVAPTGLTTPEGIGIGSSVGQLKAAYDGPDFSLDEAFFDPSQGFWTYRSADWTGLWGYTTGLTDAFVVTSINAGQGCGE